MINPEVGELYFWIQYADRERLFLIARSLVFLGKNMERTVSAETWYFQDPESYCFYGPETFLEPFDDNVDKERVASVFANDTLRTTLVTLVEDNLYQVVNCEGLARAASDCAMRRAKVGKLV
ncbi:MAG: hypothetical protein ACREQT_05050 [Candidatus Binataceae bacterium]